MNKKTLSLLSLFCFLLVLFCANTGCRMMQTPWKKDAKWFSKTPIQHELPDTPLYNGGQSDEMVEQVGYMRKGTSTTDSTETNKVQPKKWYQRPLFQSDRAEQISRNLGE